MIPIEKLKAVRTIVTHANCADGTASAMVLKTALYDAEVIFVQHGTADFENLRATDGMLFCDISPPAARVQEFVDAGAIVLDHHRTARSVVEAFGALGVFADEFNEPGVSGAVLAHREVWRHLNNRNASDVEELAELAGVRDTWQTTHPCWQAACARSAALKFYPADYLLGLASREWNTALRIGETLLAKNDERVKRDIADAHRFTVGSIRVATFNGLETSDVCEALSSEADLVVGFSYRVEQHPLAAARLRMQVSLRSRGDFDCSVLAKAWNGGGHTHAAGFTVPIFDHSSQPYQHVEQIVRTHVAGRE